MTGGTVITIPLSPFSSTNANQNGHYRWHLLESSPNEEESHRLQAEAAELLGVKDLKE